MRSEARRRISWLIAEKSFRRPFIGRLAQIMGSVPVARAMDSMKVGKGTIYLPDPVNEPTLLRGVDTDFEAPGIEPHGTINLPTINGTSHSAQISEVHGPEELVLRRPFTGRDPLFQLTGRRDINEDGHFTGDVLGGDVSEFKGSRFKVAPHVDQTAVYHAIFSRLAAGGCVGIFPEGGSHDRPDLLPLKRMFQIQSVELLQLTVFSSGRGSDGSWDIGRPSRLRPEDRAVRNELLSRPQVSVKGCG